MRTETMMGRSLNWTEGDVRAHLAKNAPRPNKYGAKAQFIDGIWFDSKREGARYSELKIMEKAGVITALKIHPVFPVVYNETRICDVILDFAYDKDGVRVFEDVKGKDNAYSVLKRKLVEAFYSIKVEIVK
jgi:DNA repair photolyase